MNRFDKLAKQWDLNPHRVESEYEIDRKVNDAEYFGFSCEDMCSWFIDAGLEMIGKNV